MTFLILEKHKFVRKIREKNLLRRTYHLQSSSLVFRISFTIRLIDENDSFQIKRFEYLILCSKKEINRFYMS